MMKYLSPTLLILSLAFTLSKSLVVEATTRASYLVKDKKEFNALMRKLNQASPNSEEQTWLRWQVALNAPLVEETTTSLAELKALSTSKQKLIPQDLISLTKGRVHFQRKEFTKAIESYQKIDKASEYWFEALEEESWAYIRQNKPEMATAKLTTLMQPVFQNWVGPETFFAANYNSLKVCDYTSVLNNGQTFKTRHTPRIQELEKLAKTGANSVTTVALSKLSSGVMDFNSFAKEAASLPRFFWRDEIIRTYVEELKQISKRKEQAEKPIEVAQLKGKLSDRLKALAQSEITEYSTVIQKLHIIEAEVIQRIYLDESLKGKRASLPSVKSDPNTLSFPYSDELWIDEVDKYKARVKGCPELKEVRR